MQGTCSTHGVVQARSDGSVLWCVCGLQCQALPEEPTQPALAEGMEPIEIDALLEEADQGGGWYDFAGVRVRGRAAALRYVMEEN